MPLDPIRFDYGEAGLLPTIVSVRLPTLQVGRTLMARPPANPGQLKFPQTPSMLADYVS